MNNDLKPIETIYNGYRFRSRLEARWAVFFDALKIKWEYEPEGFVLSNGEKYLPDFKIEFPEAPNGYAWVEIKGIEPTEKEKNRAYLLANGTGSPVFILVGQAREIEFCGYYPDNMLVFFGDNYYPMILNYDMLLRDKVMGYEDDFGFKKFLVENGYDVSDMDINTNAGLLKALSCDIDYQTKKFGKPIYYEYGIFGEYKCNCSDVVFSRFIQDTCGCKPSSFAILNAVKQARSARFEFGENDWVR